MFLALAGAVHAEAAPLTVVWDPSPSSSVVGYVVYAGSAPNSLPQKYDVGSVRTFTVPDARAGQRYCFAVAAYAPGPRVGHPSTPVCGYIDEPPTLANPGALTDRVGTRVSVQLQGGDPDGRAVTYQAGGLPAGVSLVPSTGLLSGTPTTTGAYTVRATVHDGLLSHTVSFVWTIAAGSPTAQTPPPDVDSAPASPPPDGLRENLLAVTMVRHFPFGDLPGIALIIGTADPAVDVRVMTWSNGDASGPGAGTHTLWAAIVPLTTGMNRVTIAAHDRNGATYTTRVSVSVQK